MNKAVELVEQNEMSETMAVKSEGVSPLVQMVTSGQYTPETIRELLSIQREYDQQEGLKAFNMAMTQFRANVGMASRSAKNGHLKTNYATLDDLIRAVSKPLGDAGFNYSFSIEQDTQIKVTCTITHAQGHAESTSMQSAIEGNKGINNLQAIGLTVSYLKRYTLSALTGIGTEDSDGELPATAGQKLITESEYLNVLDLVESTGGNRDAWERWASKQYPWNGDILAIPSERLTIVQNEIKKAAEKRKEGESK